FICLLRLFAVTFLALIMKFDITTVLYQVKKKVGIDIFLNYPVFFSKKFRNVLGDVPVRFLKSLLK
ncbi:MAG: hypothetical protein H6Q69_4636, partial [Firmicutes bacterium]|nr:hypothetical protein [Bacillota bacterium]